MSAILLRVHRVTPILSVMALGGLAVFGLISSLCSEMIGPSPVLEATPSGHLQPKRTAPQSQHDTSDATHAYDQGRTEATEDLKTGRLAFKRFGLPAPWEPIWTSLFWSKHQVTVHHVAGCVVTHETAERARGYNEASIPEIELHCGEAFAALCEKIELEAQMKWRQARAKD